MGNGLPNGAVINGKFRVLGERSAAGDELSFKALHLGTGRRVELRLLADGVAARGPQADRMLRSARAAGRAPHPNLLNVVDSGLDSEQRPFVVYEQFSGVPCTELVARRGPCDLRLAADIMTQVLDALSALHAAGIYHRQLRPEHVLVDGSADEVRVKVIGLGYSAQRGRESMAPDLPRGFSRYLAPEARRGEGQCSAAVDIYAAGVLMRYLLTGDAAPEAALPPQIERALARSTADDPDERFQSADQFRTCVIAMAGPSTRESLIPSGSLLSDLRFIVQRRETLLEEGGAEPPSSDGGLALYPVLLIVESLYARVGPSGWSALRAEAPEVEQLLPAAGRGAYYRSEGVPSALVATMLQQADALSGRGNLRLVVEIGEALARRGLDRICAALPGQLTPEGLVACVPVIWRSIARDGEVLPLEHKSGSARLSVRVERGATVEVTALFAGLLRGQLRALAPDGEVNLIAVQALGDGADIYVLSW